MKNTAPVNATGLPNRRTAILASLAGLAAAALPAPVLAATHVGADPTFALIKRYRAAYAAFNEALRGDVDDAPVENKAERDAMEALLTPEPTTLAGLRALAEHMAAYDERMDDFQTAQWALATIAEACRKLIGGAA